MLTSQGTTEITAGRPLRDELRGLTLDVLKDPREALQRLNPLAQLATEIASLSQSRSLDRTRESLGAGGVTGTFAERLLAGARTEGAQQVAAAQLAPILQLFAQAPAISGIGLGEGFAALGNAGQILQTTAQTAAQREASQRSVAGII